MIKDCSPFVFPSRSLQDFRNLARELSSAGFVDANFDRLAAATARVITFDAPICFSKEHRGSDACKGTPLSDLIRLFQEEEEVHATVLDSIFSSSSMDL